MGFYGYQRSDGRVGVRNHVLVMSSVSCANAVVEAIGRQCPDVKTITHTEGCGRGPENIDITLRTLCGAASHPNVAAVLVIGLGCEFIKAQLVQQCADRSEHIEHISIQACGGTPKTIARGVEIVKRMLADVARLERREFGFEHLTIAVECGGSDSLSGLTANPTVGLVSDWLVAQGGTVLLSEITEFLGTEDVVSQRCANDDVRDRMLGLLKRQQVLVDRELGSLAHMVISPGNHDGGISTIQEKSLGCIRKGGTSPIQDVLQYAERPKVRGLNVMNTPGSDVFSMTGKIAGGAQILLFTTGRGSPAGSPLAPVIKISTNTALREHMPDDIDYDAGPVITGMALSDCAAGLIATVGEVANGRVTAAELTRTDLFAIHTTGPAL